MSKSDMEKEDEDVLVICCKCHIMTQSDQCVNSAIVSFITQSLKTQGKVTVSSKQGIVEKLFEYPMTKKVLLAKKMFKSENYLIESDILDGEPVHNAVVSIQIKGSIIFCSILIFN